MLLAPSVPGGWKQMARPPGPHPDEQARMNILLGLNVLDTTPEEHFDGLVNLGKCASSSSPNSN